MTIVIKEIHVSATVGRERLQAAEPRPEWMEKIRQVVEEMTERRLREERRREGRRGTAGLNGGAYG